MYGKKIDSRIKELNISQKEIAKCIGVSNTEIKCIRNDERITLKKDTFLKLMKCLELNPYDFGGFAKLDLTDPNDFILELDFLNYLKNQIKNDPLLTARDISQAANLSEAQMSRILSGKRTEISIDCFARICNYVGTNYQNYLVDKNVVPSFYNYEEIDVSKTENLKKYISNLIVSDKDYLIEYAEFLLNASESQKQAASEILKQLKKIR